MDSYKFRDIRVEKANAISTYNRISRYTAFFRFIELFIFLVIISRFFSTHFAFSLKFEYFKGISITLISPRFVFLVGNAIVIVLCLKSGRFSSKKDEIVTDYYEEYAEKCRKNLQTAHAIIKEEKKVPAAIIKEEKKVPADTYNRPSHVRYDDQRKNIIHRSQSEKLERIVRVDDRRHELRRCVTERSSAINSSLRGEEEMSGDEFRRTVEAFIERQQRFLREEEDFSAVVSIIGT